MGRQRAVGALVAGLVTAVLAGACDTGGSPDRPIRTVPTEPPASTTTTVDVATVPAEITIAYLDAVVDRLDVVVGDAFRELVRDRGPNRRFLDLLDAVYDNPQLEEEQSVYGEMAAKGFENVRVDPGNPETTVRRIVKSKPGCVIVAGDRRFSAFFEEPMGEGRVSYVALVPKTAENDPAGINTTAWSIVLDGGTVNDVEPMSAC